MRCGEDSYPLHSAEFLLSLLSPYLCSRIHSPFHEKRHLSADEYISKPVSCLQKVQGQLLILKYFCPKLIQIL